MQNTLPDLNNHLFTQLERLSDESLKGDALKDEIARAKQVTSVSNQIIENASLMLDAKKVQLEYGLQSPVIGIEQKKEIPPLGGAKNV